MEHGVLSLLIRTELEDGTRSSLLSGADQFKKVLAHFSGRFHAIKGSWTYGDNLKAFNAATAKGSSAEEAAAKTWTGQRALEAGYPKTKILEARGKKGHFTEVRVLFSRGTR